MDRRRGVALRVDLGNHEVPFVGIIGVALGIREGVRIHINDLRVGSSLGDCDLSSNLAARRTRRAEEDEYEADEAEHAGEE
jgi:hypothetical protein